MINQIKQTLQYFYRYSIKPVRLFWLIYSFILILMLALSFSDDGAFQFTGITSAPSWIFMIFFSILTFKNVFPFIIKFGVTRKAYMLATYIYSLLLSFVMVLLNYLYLYLFNFLADVFAVEGFEFIGLNMNGFIEDALGNVYLYDWLIHLSLFLLFTFIGAFFYRFGMIYGVLLIAILPISLFIRTIGIKIIESLSYLLIFHENYTLSAFGIILVVCLLLNWLIIQRISIIDQITKQN